VRTTVIRQRRDGAAIRVTIEPAEGGYVGAPTSRDNVVELVARGLGDSEPRAVTLNGDVLQRAGSRREFDDTMAGRWFPTGDGLLLLRSGPMPVATRKTFGIVLQ